MTDLPSGEDPPEFEANIKPLFRERDRSAMLRAFDLWLHEDVSAHADAILARLRDGTMPCDGPWPGPRIDVFEQWMESGMA